MGTSLQTGLPLNYGVVEDAGSAAPVFAQPWFYFFRALWQKTGAQFSSQQNMAYAEQTGVKEITFYSVTTGAALGKVTLT